MIGSFVKLRPDIVRAVATAGHAIGNHTYSHPNLVFEGGSNTRNEIAGCELVLQEAIGPYPRLFRPPFGGRHPITLHAVRELGYLPVMWSVTSYDWKARSPQDIVDHVTKRVRGGDVILMHDGGHLKFGTDRSHTVAATDEIMRRYKGEGFQFVTIPEMTGEGTGIRVEPAAVSAIPPRA